MRLGALVRDPLTGDTGRVVGYDVLDQPIARTAGGRLFSGGKHLTGRRQLSEMYWDGDLKACNCAECRQVLLAACHAAALTEARERGEDVSGLPPLVAGRVKGRPYCDRCLWSALYAIPTETLYG